jgi:hypothetical protein
MSRFEAQILRELTDISRRLTAIETVLVIVGAHMSKELDDLTTEVKDISTASDSVLALVKGLADQIAAGAISAAVIANTPAAPPAPAP